MREHRSHDVGLDGDTVLNVDARAGHLVLRDWRTASVTHMASIGAIEFFRVEQGEFTMITRGILATGPNVALHAAAAGN